MAKTKISQYDATASNNSDIDNINIAENCSPSGINNAIRELMAHLKDLQAGNVAGNAIAVASGGTGGETAESARTNLSAAKSGDNSDITSITGLTTPLAETQGGTGATSLSDALDNLGLNTDSDAQLGSLGVGTAASGTAGEIRSTGNITAYYSDDRLKTRLGYITDALGKVNKLHGFYYQANKTAQDLGYSIKKEVGVSAQEVNSILPEIVSPAPIDNQYLTIDYARLTPLLIEAIKELDKKVKSLEEKLNDNAV